MGVATVDVTTANAGAVYKAPAKASRRPGANWLQELHHLPDALLHSRRRREARLLLRSISPRSILFICHGNICRSPFAAAAFARLYSRHIGGYIEVKSAGFIGPGRTPPQKALAASSRYGIDISAHRSAVATRADVQATDLVVVMAADQARAIRSQARQVLVLGDLDPLPVTRRTIEDPWGGSDFTFDSSYDRIVRCVGELVRVLRQTERPRKAS